MGDSSRLRDRVSIAAKIIRMLRLNVLFPLTEMIERERKKKLEQILIGFIVKSKVMVFARHRGIRLYLAFGRKKKTNNHNLCIVLLN